MRSRRSSMPRQRNIATGGRAPEGAGDLWTGAAVERLRAPFANSSPLTSDGHKAHLKVVKGAND